MRRELRGGIATEGWHLDLLARRYGKVLHAFFMRRTGYRDHDCEDLTQEVFLRLIKRGTDEDIRDIGPYVFRAASSVLTDHHRRPSTGFFARVDSYVAENDEREDFSPERVVLGREAIERVMLAIEDLPDRAKEAFVLFRFEELKHTEIAARMGISVSAVEKHVRLAMMRAVQAVRDAE